MNPQDLVVTKVAPQCGAEVSGLNLAQPLDKSTVRSLEMALAEHGVLFFRDQPMTAEQQKRLGHYFGDLHLHPAWPRLVDGYPEVMELLTDENSTYIAGEDWHSDVSCDPQPPLGTILQMLEVPPTGGDTLFANMVAALAALPAEQQQYLSGLTALHDGEQHYRGRYDGPDDAEKVYPQAEHPLVRTHPETGRKALWINSVYSIGVKGLNQIEAKSLLDKLFAHSIRDEFVYRHRWSHNMLTMWDNRCVQHCAQGGYDGHRRVMHRTTVAGDAPF